MSNDRYSIVEADIVGESKAILEFWESADIRSPQRQKKKYNWFYVDNPAGRGLAFWLRDNVVNECIGIDCIGVRDWVIDGTRVQSGVFVDLIVHPAHRSLLPAMLLIKEVAWHARKQLQFVCGFPNAKSAPLYKRADIKMLGVLVRYARVIRIKSYLHAGLPRILLGPFSFVLDCGLAGLDKARLAVGARGMRYGWVNEFGKSFDSFWTAICKAGKVMAVRDSASLNWRHKKCPDADSNKVFVLWDKNGLVVGYIVCVFDGRVLVVRDFFSAGDKKVTKILFLGFIVEARKMQGGAISVEFFGDPAIVSVLKSVGFRPREERPIYYTLSPSVSEEKIRSCKWFVTSSEEDM